MVRRVYLGLALITLLICFANIPAVAQSGRIFYVDYASGSNSNNGTSKSTPWKTHPYMQSAAGCAGSSPAYSHQAGDQFIFKGNVTWPAACFQMNVVVGGSPGSPDYYGVDKTWFSGSSFSRPLFDMAYTFTNGAHVVSVASGVSNVTFDNFEVYRQLIAVTNGFTGAGYAFAASNAGSNIVIKNSYMHDWATSQNFTDSTFGDWGAGCIGGGTPSSGYHAIMDTSTCSDTNGYFFQSGVQQFVPFGGACENCAEVKNSTFHHTFAACFSALSCHDSEFHDITSSANAFCNAGGSGCHTQVIENDIGSIGESVYNNLIHDNSAAVIIFACAGDTIYNNVIWNSVGGGGDPPIMMDSNCGSNSSTLSKVYNNTAECGGGNCFRAFARGSSAFGQLVAQNNLWINTTNPLCINNPNAGCATTSGGTISNNYAMSSSEASTYGFTSVTKYAPSSSDPHVTGQGVNLLSSAAGSLAALAFDTAGAVWYGGSYNARAATWDLGAFVNNPQSTASKPSPPSNLAAIVQ